MEQEIFISRAEIAYKSGNIKNAIKFAKRALSYTGHCEPFAAIPRLTALQVFIARAYSKLGNYRESNAIYRKLLNEQNYLPPVIMGLLYNNFQNPRKTDNNIKLMKIFVRTS